MTLGDITAQFIKLLNSTIPKIDSKNREQLLKVEHIKSRMSVIKLKTASAEQKIHNYLKHKECSNIKATDYVIIRHEGNLKAIVSESLQKPEISAVDPISVNCSCPIPLFTTFNPIKSVTLIDSEDALFELDKSLHQVLVCVYDHSYRSYPGFTCYIAIATPDGGFYAIDAMKLRLCITKLRLLGCGVKKLIHCSDCVNRLFKDFGGVGCYRSFDVCSQTAYIDWRIRPFDQNFAMIMHEQMGQLIEKSNQGIHSERHEPLDPCETSEFVERYGLPCNCPFAEDVIKFRTYLAKKYDEGIQYVMTDKQLLLLLNTRPESVEEFENTLPAMSPILRLHVGDFVIIFMKKSKSFSMDRLKEKAIDAEQYSHTDNATQKYRSFSKKPKFTRDTDEEDFVISSEHN